MKNIIKVPKIHVILGKQLLDKDKFNPIKNREGFSKPKGGLWASPYYPNRKYVSAWHEWCDCEQSDWLTNDSVVLELKDDIRCFVIDSQRDLIKLFYIVGEARSDYLCFMNSILKVLDFENAAKMFDAIYLTEKGQWETRMPLQRQQYNLYGWDCESILIMNLTCIEKWEYKKLDIVKEENLYEK